MGLLAFTGSNWRYTALGGMDNWSYVGYAKHYADPEYRAGLYKGCRLPWIWWQYAVRNFFPGEPGSRALCYSLLLAWVGAWYFFARQFAGPSPAALLGIFALLYVPAHGPGGWDYPSLAAGIFLVAAMALSVQIGREKIFTRGNAFFLGVLLAVAVHTYITSVNFLPALALLLWPALRPFQPQRLAVAAGWVVAGGLLATFLLGAVNVSVGRRPFFYWKMVEAVLHFVGDSSQQTPWYQPLGAEWILQAHYLAFPVAALVLSIFSFTREKEKIIRRLFLFHVFLCFVWIAWHLLGQTALNIDFFAFPLSLSALPVLLAVNMRSPKYLAYSNLICFAVLGIGILSLGGVHLTLPPPWPLLVQILFFLLALCCLRAGTSLGFGLGLTLWALANGLNPQVKFYQGVSPGPELKLAHAAILKFQDWAWPVRNELPRPPSPSLRTVLSGRSFQTDPLAHLIWDPDHPNGVFQDFAVSLGSTDFEMSFPQAKRRALGKGMATANDFVDLKSGMCLFVAEEPGDGYADGVKKNLQRLGIPFQAGPAREIRMDWGAVRLERILFL